MPCLHHTSTVALATAAALVFSAATHAAVITPVNGSFQDPILPDAPGSTTSVPDFTKFGASDRTRIQYNESVIAPTGGAAIFNGDGDQFFLIDDRAGAFLVGAFQNLGTIEADFTYTLDLKVAKRTDLALPGEFEYGLYTNVTDGFTPPNAVVVEDETTVVGAGTLAAALDSSAGTFLDRTLTFDTLSGNNAALVGQDLFVQMAILGESGPGNADQIAFDALIVTSTPIPEPTSAAALLGLSGLMLRRRRS
jgi:hypothetical protein